MKMGADMYYVFITHECGKVECLEFENKEEADASVYLECTVEQTEETLGDE